MEHKAPITDCPRQGTSKSAKEWKKICLQNKIPPFVQKSLLVSIVDLPRFYHLIKTHKAGPNVKIRPIISNINEPTQRISWLLANALKPMLKNVPAQLDLSKPAISPQRKRYHIHAASM